MQWAVDEAELGRTACPLGLVLWGGGGGEEGTGGPRPNDSDCPERRVTKQLRLATSCPQTVSANRLRDACQQGLFPSPSSTRRPMPGPRSCQGNKPHPWRNGNPFSGLGWRGLEGSRALPSSFGMLAGWGFPCQAPPFLVEGQSGCQSGGKIQSWMECRWPAAPSRLSLSRAGAYGTLSRGIGCVLQKTLNLDSLTRPLEGSREAPRLLKAPQLPPGGSVGRDLRRA